jgi:hypothetical protein
MTQQQIRSWLDPDLTASLKSLYTLVIYSPENCKEEADVYLSEF